MPLATLDEVNALLAAGGASNPGTGTPSLTLDQVDAEIATALTAKGLPPGATVPGLIAAAGTGTGVSAAQAAALALVLG